MVGSGWTPTCRTLGPVSWRSSGLQSIQYTFSADNASEASKLYRGASPSNDGTELSTDVMPEGFPMAMAPERREEYAPGLDADLLALIQATAEVEMKEADNPKEPNG